MNSLSLWKREMSARRGGRGIFRIFIWRINSENPSPRCSGLPFSKGEKCEECISRKVS